MKEINEKCLKITIWEGLEIATHWKNISTEMIRNAPLVESSVSMIWAGDTSLGA